MAETMEVPTPIPVTRRTRRQLVAAGALVLVLVLWRAPTLLGLLVGGVMLALALAFPVSALSRRMPRRAAVAVAILLAVGLGAVAIGGVGPIVIEQLRSLIDAAPGIVRRLAAQLRSVPGLEAVDQQLAGLGQELPGRVLGRAGEFASGLAGAVVTLIGSAIVGVYLLADMRRIQAAVIRAAPHASRRDVRALRLAFTDTFSRYLSGLAVSAVTEGVLAAIALYLLKVPYALLFGAWIALTALVPVIGSWIGYGPAVLLALAISPERGLLTLVVTFLINTFVGNVISPRIQGGAVHVHPILIFLGIIAGGELFGVLGVVLALPAIAALRVLYDFLRVRVRVVDA